MNLAIVPLLSFGAFMTVLGLRATDPLLPMIAQTYGILPGAASITITGFGIGYGLLQVIHGPLGDRFGKFRMMAFLAIGSAVSSFLCAMAPTLGMLVAARIAQGAMTGGLIPLSMAWIGDAVPYEKRQAVIARFLLGNFTGIALGPSLCSYIAEASDWRMPFMVMAVMYLIAAVLFWKSDDRRAAHSDGQAGQVHRQTVRESFLGMVSLLGNTWVRIVLGCVFISGAWCSRRLPSCRCMRRPTSARAPRNRAG